MNPTTNYSGKEKNLNIQSDFAKEQANTTPFPSCSPRTNERKEKIHDFDAEEIFVTIGHETTSPSSSAKKMSPSPVPAHLLMREEGRKETDGRVQPGAVRQRGPDWSGVNNDDDEEEYGQEDSIRNREDVINNEPIIATLVKNEPIVPAIKILEDVEVQEMKNIWWKKNWRKFFLLFIILMLLVVAIIITIVVTITNDKEAEPIESTDSTNNTQLLSTSPSSPPSEMHSYAPSEIPTTTLQVCDMPAYVYFLSDKTKFFEYHVQEAEMLGFRLASIHSREENEFVERIIEGQSHWLGGQRTAEKDDEFEWVDGSGWEYDLWKSGEPNNSGPIGGEDKVEISSDGTWNDVNKERYRRAVYKRVFCLSDLDSNGLPKALDGSYGKEMFCDIPKYVVSDVQMSFYEHITKAQEMGFDLASIHNEGENAIFNLRVFDRENAYWIGGRRSSSYHDKWEWIDGSEWDFEQWAEGEPNDLGGENAVLVPLFLGNGPTWGDYDDESIASGALYKSVMCAN